MSDGLWRRLRRRWKNWRHRRFDPWRVQSYGGIRVHSKEWLDGGGSWFGQEIITLLQDRGMPRQARAFEWCAGPGFIGFSLLGNGLCETLCLADVNPVAVEACRRTIADNGLADRVAVYHSDNLSAIPSEERWDLVVSNPPHYDRPGRDLRAHDTGWQTHRQFFAAVARFLRPGGMIVLQENNLGATAETFREMIEAAGLRVVFTDGCASRANPEAPFFYIGIMRRGDTPPAWALTAAATRPSTSPASA